MFEPGTINHEPRTTNYDYFFPTMIVVWAVVVAGILVMVSYWNPGRGYDPRFVAISFLRLANICLFRSNSSSSNVSASTCKKCVRDSCKW